MNNDTNLIYENYKTKIHPAKYQQLLENDLKEFEKFLISEGIFDKFKQKAVQAGKGVKDFATQKLLQPVIDNALKFLAKNDPETLKKLQAAQGDKAATDAILAQGKQEQEKIKQSIETTNESSEYFTNYHIFSQIVFNEGIVSENKANLIIERYAEEDGEADIAKGLGFKNREEFRVAARAAGGIAQYFSQNPDKAKIVNWDTSKSNAANFNSFTKGNVSAAQPQQGNVSAAQPQQGGEGFIKKTWNWVKANPIKTSAGALAILGMVAVAAPAIAPAILAGALKGGGIGAATGAVTGTIQGMKDTKGELKGMDRFKQVAKTAGKKALTKGLAGAAVGGAVGGVTGAVTNKLQAMADAKDLAANTDAVQKTAQMSADQAERAKELVQAQDASLDQIKQNPRLSPGGNKIPIENDPFAKLDSKGRGGWRPSRGNNRLARGLARGLGR